MSGMLERAIFEVLKQGREKATEDSEFLVQFFCSLGGGITETEAREIKTYWDSITIPNEDYPDSPQKGVDIIHSYPRGPNAKFPCWSIVLMGENEGSDKTSRFLGDEVDDLYDDNDNYVGDCLGSLWDATYGIYVFAKSPDLCIYYYELVRFFMTRARPLLKSLTGGQVLDTAFSGADMSPDPRYAPTHMFVRRFTIQARTAQTVLSAVQSQRGTSIGGIHRGPTPAEGQVSDVSTANVDTYTE